MGKVVLALACNSIMGIQREHIQQSMELVSRNYSADLKNLILFVGIRIYFSIWTKKAVKLQRHVTENWGNNERVSDVIV